MTKSTYSRPRAPSARTWRWGSAGSRSPPSTPSPNNASGRLLPVDVKPGTRQSFTVFPDLDGHRAQQLRLPLVERRPVDHLAHRAHDGLSVPRLEELYPLERPFHVGEQPLQLRGGCGPGRAARGFEGS